MDFPDIICRNNNYVKILHATGNNENKNINFIQQFYIPKHTGTRKSSLSFISGKGNRKSIFFTVKKCETVSLSYS